ncbi:MAG TPA: Lsr2 family protein [Candidatus Ruania gallistercoris]|uniref:Lsr2 family protein n=1 Tax=Candidatus Ruania gallistercoris TaxID=2838746 RepID=A0A9D2EBC9_9MICO|nr:Lsr2 family protein [Candidatus Ruania gallistercoris]
MATKTVVDLSDDLDGTPAQHTVRFALEDSVYEIDLNSANRDKLVAAMAPFAAAGRRVNAAGTGATGAATPVDARAVREWARVNDIEVPARGRIPDRVVEQYRAAGN